MPLLRPFWWETRMTHKSSNAQKVNLISQKKFQIYPGLSMRSKTDKCEYLRGPTQKIFNFFFSGLHTSSMNGFCKNWKWLVILLLKSQSTQCAYIVNNMTCTTRNQCGMYCKMQILRKSNYFSNIFIANYILLRQSRLAQF